MAEYVPTIDDEDWELPAEEPAAEAPAEDLDAIRAQAAVVERFNRDPEFARAVITQRAQALGLQLQQPTATPEAPVQPQTMPAAFVQEIATALGPNFAFMAEALAPAMWRATRSVVTPLEQSQQQLQQQHTQALTQAQRQQFEGMLARLDEGAPGWRQHEQDIYDMLGFLQGALSGNGPLEHRRYGNVLEVLYGLVSGQGLATARATRRMGQAARSAVRSGTTGGALQRSGPDITEQIRGAKTSRDQIGIALRQALREFGAA